MTRHFVCLLFAVAACNGDGDPPGGGDAPSATDAPVGIDGADGDVIDGAVGDAAAADANVADAETVDAGVPDGPVACAPPVGDWAGTIRFWYQGSGSHDRTTADVTWTLESTTDCVDRYVASGTVTLDAAGHCSLELHPDHAAIAATDGTMIVDRTVTPPTYRIEGATEWEYMHNCTPESGEDNGPFLSRVQWGRHHGIISGDVFGGALPVDSSNAVDWHFERVGAVITPPVGCVGAAVDTVVGAHHTLDVQFDINASVTWSRTSTDGCVDHYAPSGTVSIVGHPYFPACPTFTVSPTMGTVGASDGSMTIDRSTNPPTFSVNGGSFWTGQMSCTHADGTVETSQGTIGDVWGGRGPLTPPVTGGGLWGWYSERSWQLTM